MIPLFGGNSQTVHTWHHLGLWGMVFVTLHVYAAIREDIMGRQSMVSTMISGYRTFKTEDRWRLAHWPPSRPAARCRACLTRAAAPGALPGASHHSLPLAMTQTEAARRLGVSRRRINELVQAKRAMSPTRRSAARSPSACRRASGSPCDRGDGFQAWKALRRAQRAA